MTETSFARKTAAFNNEQALLFYFLNVVTPRWSFKICMLVFSPSQLKTEFLPLLSVIFVSENSVVAAVSIKHTHSRISARVQTQMNVLTVKSFFRAMTVAPCCSVVTIAER